MSIRIINGKVYKNGAFSEEELVLKEGKIVSAQDGDAEEVYDAKGNYVVPGFIDVHTHGGAGVDVNAADQQGFEKIGHFFATQGRWSIKEQIYLVFIWKDHSFHRNIKGLCRNIY